MTWQEEMPTAMLGENLERGSRQWQNDFVYEWHRLSEGCADMEQTPSFAMESYAQQGTRNPVVFSREFWGVALYRLPARF